MTNDVKKIVDILTPKSDTHTTTSNSDVNNEIAKNSRLMMNGDTLKTNTGVFFYSGIYNGKHALYPSDKETEKNILEHPKAIKDNQGNVYLGLNDSELSYLVDKFKTN